MRSTIARSGPSKVLYERGIISGRSVGFPTRGSRYNEGVANDIEHPYTPKKFKPNVSHPGYLPDEIMDFRDRSSKLPPAVARQRQEKLKTARKMGIHHTKFNSPKKVALPLPNVPVRLQYPVKEERVKYQVGKTGVTNERLSFFYATEEQEGDWSGGDLEGLALETGRIVEVRRSGQMSVGMILASMMVSGRHRFLLLRSNGEVWPISKNDIQFVMPKTLINQKLADDCWSQKLLTLWAKGDDVASEEITQAMAPMQGARRKAVMVLRKIVRETEKMCGKMMGEIGRSHFGGMEGFWEKLAPQEEGKRASITSAEAAEVMLNAGNFGTALEKEPIVVRPNTLPAFAAHSLLMGRADLFLADPGDMATSSRFLIRSRAERERSELVNRLVQSRSEEDRAAFNSFIEKAKKVVAHSQKIKAEGGSAEQAYSEAQACAEQWNVEDKAIISAMMARLYETRSTQVQSGDNVITTIMKLVDAYDPEVTLDRDMTPIFLADLGVLPPWDTLKKSEVLETESRAMAIANIEPSRKTEMLQGHELDKLRRDFTSHRVFVVDDISASELDDGISIQRVPRSDNVWIHVHIADPTRYIPLNSSIATRASFRGSSVYLAEGNLPLFPLDVIMQQLSLGAEVDRDDGAQGTMTFSTKLSPNGKVVDFAVHMGWIKSPRVVTYAAVDEALGVTTGSRSRPLGTPTISRPKRNKDYTFTTEDLEDLKLLQQFANAYRKNRMKSGGLDFKIPSASIGVIANIPESSRNLFDPSQIPSSPHFYVGQPIYDMSVAVPPTGWTGLPATDIIAEMMILSGRTAAKFCKSRGLPVPYRLSSAPSPTALPGQKVTRLGELLELRDPESFVTDYYTLKAANAYMGTGEVSLTPGQHWQMGFLDNNGYVRATSPLRRFEDMLVHWQIKSALASEKGLPDASVLAPRISDNEMTTFIKRSDPPQRKAKKLSDFSHAWWQAGLYMSRLKDPRPAGYTYGEDAIDIREPMIGRVAAATVYGTTSSATTTDIYLPTLGMMARLPGMGQQNYTIGQEIKVRMIKAEQWLTPIVDVEAVD